MSQVGGGAVTVQPRSEQPAVSPVPAPVSCSCPCLPVCSRGLSPFVLSSWCALFSSGIRQKEGRGKRARGLAFLGCKLESGLLLSDVFKALEN